MTPADAAGIVLLAHVSAGVGALMLEVVMNFREQIRIGETAPRHRIMFEGYRIVAS